MAFHVRAGILLAALSFACGHLAGQGVESVRQAILDHYQAINAGNTRAVIDQHAAVFTGFLADGGPRLAYRSRAEQIKAWVDGSEGKAKGNDLRPRDIEVTLHGDVAVATFYVDGTLRWARGETLHGPWRVTEVWVWEQGRWKEHHHHDSMLRFSR